MDWTLFRIFFWCPARVTPILRRSLEDRQTEGHQWTALLSNPASWCHVEALDLLRCHLGDQLEGGEASAQEVVSVLAHLDGTQPVFY